MRTTEIAADFGALTDTDLDLVEGAVACSPCDGPSRKGAGGRKRDRGHTRDCGCCPGGLVERDGLVTRCIGARSPTAGSQGGDSAASVWPHQRRMIRADLDGEDHEQD
jgi:hypothetical protein